MKAFAVLALIVATASALSVSNSVKPIKNDVHIKAAADSNVVMKSKTLVNIPKDGHADGHHVHSKTTTTINGKTKVTEHHWNPHHSHSESKSAKSDASHSSSKSDTATKSKSSGSGSKSESKSESASQKSDASASESKSATK